MTDSGLSWKFPREFWMANVMELLERAAYYGFFIVLTLYLTDIVGFNDHPGGYYCFFHPGEDHTLACLFQKRLPAPQGYNSTPDPSG